MPTMSTSCARSRGQPSASETVMEMDAERRHGNPAPALTALPAPC
jgi:hypothetical protein